MNKRGQVTIFVIIAIAVVVIAGGIYYFSTNEDPGGQDVPEGYEDFRDFMDGCLEDVLEGGLNRLGYQGGYFDIDDKDSIYFFSTRVPYYLNERDLKIPSEEVLINELRKYLEISIRGGCNALTYYEESDEYGADAGELNFELELKNDKVTLEVNYPNTITKADSTVTIEDFYVEVPVRLKEVYETAAEIIVLQIVDPYNVCLNCIEEIRDPGIKVDAYIWDENSFVFMLRDYSSSLKDNNGDGISEPYRYFFAIKYIDWNCDNLPEDMDDYIKEECELQKQVELEYG